MFKQYYLKIFILSLCLCWGSSPTLLSQNDGGKKDKIESLRIAFITQRLDLSTKEAQAFWPVYNEYLDQLEVIRTGFKQNYNKKTDYHFKTDKEAEAYIRAEIQLKEKENNLFKEYYEKFMKVLPVKKVALLRRAEEDFKKELLLQLQGKTANE